MTISIISITIRPPLKEFIKMKKPMDEFISWASKRDEIVVGIEKGKKKVENHYQVYLKTEKHINAVREKINHIFKPELSSLTKTRGVWKKVKLHNEKISLLGYVLKEDNIYYTNVSIDTMRKEKQKYLRSKYSKITIWYCRKHHIFRHPVYHPHIAEAEECVRVCGNKAVSPGTGGEKVGSE